MSEVRDQKTGVRGQRPEDGCQRSETGRRMSEVRDQKTGVRGQRTEDGCQKGRGQKTEYREQVELLIDDNRPGITSKILRPFAKN
jgi:hypothetical protein